LQPQSSFFWHVTGVTQMPPEQSPFVQSLAWTQGLQSAQGGQVGPPQSIPVSSSSGIPSWQLVGQPGTLQPKVKHFGWQTPPAQRPLAQSPYAPHGWQSAHGRQSAPPQSTSLSSLSRAPLLQWVPAQCSAMHEPLAQSASTPQRWLPMHGWQMPPQSTSVSVPSSARSKQVWGWQWPWHS
jgi:hypothetical protein